MADCDPCKTVDCANEDDYALYNLQSGVTRPAAVPNTSEPCEPCKTAACDNGAVLEDDYRLYQLQTELYPLVIPFNLANPGATMRLPCCGIILERVVEQGTSDGQLNFLLGQMIDECALRMPFCRGGVGGTTVSTTYDLRATCCDGSVVVRQVSLTTPGATIDAILAQMFVECGLHAGCAGRGQGYLEVLEALAAVDLAITQAITNLGIILGGFITNTPGSLENASTLLEITATTLDNAGTALENAINDLLAVGGLSVVQIAVLNVGLEIANILHVISDVLDLLGDLAHTLSIGGDITAIITQLVNLTGSLDNAATDLETSITNLLSVITVTPCVTLFAGVALVVAETLRVVGDIIGGYSASSVLAAAFQSNVPSQLTSAATVATNAGNALTATATELGTRLATLQTALNAAIAAGCASPSAQIQADINLGNAIVSAYLCLATALVRMAAVATAQATGIGMAAALAALEAVAVCLESASATLIATGDAGAIALADILQDLADGLRQLALGNITPEQASIILQRTFLIVLIESITIMLRFLLDLEQLWRRLLDDAIAPVTVSLRCGCGGNVVTSTLPSGISASQRNALFGSMIDRCLALCPPAPPGHPGAYPPGTPPYLTFQSAPQHCTVYCPDGTPFSWTTPLGLVVGFSQAEVNLAARSLACEQAAFYRICLSNLPAFFCVGSAFSANITSSGGSGNVWSVIGGAIPTGLSLVPHGTFATLAGTATGTGEWEFTVQVVASNGARNQKTYSMQGLQILPATLPTFQVGSSYSVQLTLSGASGTITFSITSGALPDGISLTNDGLLSGIPTSTSAFSFAITAVVS